MNADETRKPTGPLHFDLPDGFDELPMEDRGRVFLHHFLETGRAIMHGLNTVTGDFTGSGDSADDIGYTFKDSDGESWYDVTISAEVEGHLDNFIWTFIDNNYGGWENNEGGFGSVTFDLDARSCVLDMYYRVQTDDPQGETALFADEPVVIEAVPTPEVTDYPVVPDPVGERFIVHVTIGKAVTVTAKGAIEAEQLALEELPDGWNLVSTEVEEGR
jgi:hypothetical protein